MTTRAQGSSLILGTPKGELLPLLKDCVRHLRASAVCLSRSDRDFLDSISRSTSGYGFLALERLLEISARCEVDAHALTVPDACRSFVITRRLDRPRIGWFPATIQENESNHLLNQAQHRVQFEWTRSRLEEVIEYSLVQEAMSIRLRDESLHEHKLLGSRITIVR